MATIRQKDNLLVAESQGWGFIVSTGLGFVICFGLAIRLFSDNYGSAAWDIALFGFSALAGALLILPSKRRLILDRASKWGRWETVSSIGFQVPWTEKEEFRTGKTKSVILVNQPVSGKFRVVLQLDEFYQTNTNVAVSLDEGKKISAFLDVPIIVKNA